MKTAKYPMILYNLSNWFGNKEFHVEALKMAELGVDFCIQYGNLAFFPILVVNKGVALAEIGKIEDARKCLHQAIAIFEAMKQVDHVQPVIDWCKIHYKMDI